jgi:hypothetical protein
MLGYRAKGMNSHLSIPYMQEISYPLIAVLHDAYLLRPEMRRDLSAWRIFRVDSRSADGQRLSGSYETYVFQPTAFYCGCLEAGQTVTEAIGALLNS